VRRRKSRATSWPPYDLTEILAPSNPGAIKKIVRPAEKEGFGVELIRATTTAACGVRRAFIRETTAINHHFRFAQRATVEVCR
jgi:hypothetical protein